MAFHTVNTSVTVLIGLTDHLIDLIVSQLLTDGGHDVAELGGGNEAVVVAVEDLCLSASCPCVALMLCPP
jgi:hypothetical protein